VLPSCLISESSWFRLYAPRPEAGTLLICFPHAGGGANGFRSWADLLPPSVGLAAVQYPGRQDRYGEAFTGDLPTMTDEIARAVVNDFAGRRLAFFGHSLGATIAFEVAMRLRYLPGAPTRLFASAAKAPGDRVSSNFAAFTDAELKGFVRRLRGGDDPMLADELWCWLAPTLRKDLSMLDTYRYQQGERLACPITAIAGDRDLTATAADLRRWADYTTDAFDIHLFPGGHFYLEAQPEQLTALLTEGIG